MTGLELAAALGVSHVAARALLTRARESLRQALAAEREAIAKAEAAADAAPGRRGDAIVRPILGAPCRRPRPRPRARGARLDEPSPPPTPPGSTSTSPLRRVRLHRRRLRRGPCRPARPPRRHARAAPRPVGPHRRRIEAEGGAAAPAARAPASGFGVPSLPSPAGGPRGRRDRRRRGSPASRSSSPGRRRACHADRRASRQRGGPQPRPGRRPRARGQPPRGLPDHRRRVPRAAPFEVAQVAGIGSSDDVDAMISPGRPVGRDPAKRHRHRRRVRRAGQDPGAVGLRPARRPPPPRPHRQPTPRSRRRPRRRDRPPRRHPVRPSADVTESPSDAVSPSSSASRRAAQRRPRPSPPRRLRHHCLERRTLAHADAETPPEATPTPPRPRSSPSPRAPTARWRSRATSSWSMARRVQADGPRFAFTARPADGSGGPDVYVWRTDDPLAHAITPTTRRVRRLGPRRPPREPRRGRRAEHRAHRPGDRRAAR